MVEARKRGRNRALALSGELEDIFDISREIDLLKEIKDIRDELNILRNLFSQQERVLESFCSVIEAASQKAVNDTRTDKPRMTKAIDRQAQYVRGLDADAKRQYKAVNSQPLFLSPSAD